MVIFRQTHRAKLLAFREVVDDFEKSLAADSSKEDVKRSVEKFKEKVELETIHLREALRLSFVSTALGTLQAFIKPNSPTLLGAAAVVAGVTNAFVW